MDIEFIKTVSILRKIIAKYGEELAWWPTSFFKESSETFIEYDFPRLKNANLILASDIIRNLMDQKVGLHKFHLFRLGIKYEERIHQFLLANEIDSILGKDELEQLSQFIQVNQKPGPKNIGSIEDLELDGTIQVMAAEYLNAIRNIYEVYPYLN